MKDILPAKVVTRKRKKCMFRVWNMHFSALYQIICTNFYHALLIFLHSEE